MTPLPPTYAGPHPRANESESPRVCSGLGVGGGNLLVGSGGGTVPGAPDNSGAREKLDSIYFLIRREEPVYNNNEYITINPTWSIFLLLPTQS